MSSLDTRRCRCSFIVPAKDLGVASMQRFSCRAYRCLSPSWKWLECCQPIVSTQKTKVATDLVLTRSIEQRLRKCKSRMSRPISTCRFVNDLGANGSRWHETCVNMDRSRSCLRRYEQWSVSGFAISAASRDSSQSVIVLRMDNAMRQHVRSI